MPDAGLCEAQPPMQVRDDVPVAVTYDVQMRRIENGFIVNVGCKTFVTQDLKEVFDGLALYFKDPNAARKKYCRKEN